jgi:hypothetical protein
MQHLNTLWKIANAASDVAEMARSSDVYRFNVAADITFYLHTAHAEVRVRRWDEPRIDVLAQLQAPFGWQVKTDQDEAGVYFVARRKPVVGNLSGAIFTIVVPPTTHLLLKLDQCRLVLDDLTSTVQLPPQSQMQTLMLGEPRA